MLIAILRKTLFRTDNQPKEKEADMTTKDKAFDYLKYVVSFCVLTMYFSYLMFGMWSGEALLSDTGVPGPLVFVVFSCCILFLALLEGAQVGILVRENKDPEENNFPETHPRAVALMKRATHEKNVRRFLIGRQFFVIFVVFLINQCTIYPDIQTFGVNSILWFFVIQLGLPTALNVLCFGQLPAQLLANLDPMLFLNRPGPRFTLEVCLFTELTGIAHFSWVVTGLSILTWFKVSPTALDDLVTFKDVEAVKGRVNDATSQTEDVTSLGGQTDNNTDTEGVATGYNKIPALELGAVNEHQEV
jgi:hypothetical protein